MRALAALVLVVSSSFGQFRAGAAKRIITPDLSRRPVYMAGFGQNRVATRIHDDLYARCIALEAGHTLVICGVDSIGLFLDDIEKIRDAANDHLNQPVDIVVAALHDHEAPDTMGLWGPAAGTSGIDEDYNLYVIDRVAEAAVDAVRSLRPAVVKLASVKNPELDSFINDDRPPRVLDSELILLSAAEPSGKPIATLANWANHPETLGAKNTQITADYPGYFYKEMEKRLGGVAVLVNGAVGGMQSPLGAKIPDPKTGKPAAEESFRKAQLLGERVAGLGADAIRAAKPADIDDIEFCEAPVQVPVTNSLFRAASTAGIFKHRKAISADGAMGTRAGMFRLGNSTGPVLEAALVPGELYPELSVGGVARYYGADYPDAEIEPAVKPMMSAPFRMLIGLADDEIGYLIPKAEWDEAAPWLEDAPKAWYGEISSVGPDAAKAVIETIEDCLSRGREDDAEGAQR